LMRNTIEHYTPHQAIATGSTRPSHKKEEAYIDVGKHKHE